jgi:hypothetical protein
MKAWLLVVALLGVAALTSLTNVAPSAAACHPAARIGTDDAYVYVDNGCPHRYVLLCVHITGLVDKCVLVS